jgi:hypothetical protein
VCLDSVQDADIFGQTFRQLEAHLGKKKAAVAITYKILVIMYYLLAEETGHDEQRCAQLQPRQKGRWQGGAVKALEVIRLC